MKTRRPVDLFATAEPARPQLEVTLFSEPEEEVLVLRLVMQDAELINDKLRGSVRKTSADYRGDLRVIMGAAQRIKDRCARLIGDVDTGSKPTPPTPRNSRAGRNDGKD